MLTVAQASGRGSRPDGQQQTVLNYFTVFRGDPIFSRMGGGSNFFQGRVQMLSIETHITCDFPGRSPDPLSPLWIRTWGRLTPLFVYTIMVYQNLKKMKNATQRRLNGNELSPAVRDSMVYTGKHGVRIAVQRLACASIPVSGCKTSESVSLKSRKTDFLM